MLAKTHAMGMLKRLVVTKQKAVRMGHARVALSAWCTEVESSASHVRGRGARGRNAAMI
jgi:hypothetical protein